jgi:hypothetical protein
VWCAAPGLARKSDGKTDALAKTWFVKHLATRAVFAEDSIRPSPGKLVP